MFVVWISIQINLAQQRPLEAAFGEVEIVMILTRVCILVEGHQIMMNSVIQIATEFLESIQLLEYHMKRSYVKEVVKED